MLGFRRVIKPTYKMCKYHYEFNLYAIVDYIFVIKVLNLRFIIVFTNNIVILNYCIVEQNASK